MKKYVISLFIAFSFTIGLLSQPVIILPGTTTWNINRTQCGGDVTILNGGTLIITNCTVSLCPGVRITVLTGGNLIITNATLTNFTTGQKWGGIYVYGTSSLAPNAVGQNGVQITHGNILNADCGIIAYSSAYVKAKESNFTNNTIGVNFQNIYGPSGVQGTFELTNFNIDYSYFGNPFDTHIKANSSGSQNVLGCNLYGTFSLDGSNLNKGIDVVNTPLTVTEYCASGMIDIYTGKCQGGVPCLFMGLNYGVLAVNTGTSPALRIAFNFFTYNLHTITINAVNNYILYTNEINLNIPNSYGAEISNATGYTIRENEFNDYSLSSTGMTITSSGGDENEIRRNEFKYFNIGLHCIGQNSIQGAYNNTGLQLLCNDFKYSVQNDILVSGSASPFIGPSIRRAQGSVSVPAGNLFSQTTVVDFESQSVFDIDYNHGITDPREIPTILGLITLFNTGKERYCPPPGPPTKKNALNQYDEWNTEFEYWFSKLLAAEIGSEEYYVFLNEVSYYSGLKDNFFNSLITEARNDEKTLNEKEKIENVRTLLIYRGNYTDYLSLIETYLSERDYGEAMATLSTMYKRLDATEEQTLELIGLETYIQWLQQLEGEGGSIYKLSDKEITYLVNFVANNTGRGAVFAENILCAIYYICTEKEVIQGFSVPKNQNGESVTNSAMFASQMDGKALSDRITVVPNPTTGELSITNYELRIDKIEILDIAGKVVSSHHQITTSSHQKINISNLSPGIYFVKIFTEEGDVVKRIVKQ